MELNLFKTGLEDSELCQVLVGLKNITQLPRGDFLCDVLEYLEDEVSLDIQFKIQNFWASEDYFFHTEEQMLLVAKYCPMINKALFSEPGKIGCKKTSSMGRYDTTFTKYTRIC